MCLSKKLLTLFISLCAITATADWPYYWPASTFIPPTPIDWHLYSYINQSNGPYLAGSNVALRLVGTNGQLYIDAILGGGMTTNALTAWALSWFYPSNNPNGFITQTGTNGLASIAYVDHATNGFNTNAWSRWLTESNYYAYTNTYLTLTNYSAFYYSNNMFYLFLSTNGGSGTPMDITTVSNAAFWASNTIVTMPTDTWNTVAAVSNNTAVNSNWVVNLSNRVENLPSNTWNTVAAVSNNTAVNSNWVVNLSNRVENLPSNTWNTVAAVSNNTAVNSNWVVNLSNRVENLPSNTWNTVAAVSNNTAVNSNWVVNLSNRVENLPSNIWNTVSAVSNNAAVNSNWMVNLSNRVENLPTNSWGTNGLASILYVDTATNNTDIMRWINMLPVSNVMAAVSNMVYSWPTDMWNTVSAVSNNTAVNSNWVVNLSNRVENLPSNTWDTVIVVSNTAAWASNNAGGVFSAITVSNAAFWASNSIVNMPTDLWNTVSAVSNNAAVNSNCVINLSNRVENLPSNIWNTVAAVSNNASAVSNWVLAVSNNAAGVSNAFYNMPTSVWNTASNWIITVSNNAAGVSNAFYNMPTSVWNTASNWIITVSNNAAGISNLFSKYGLTNNAPAWTNTGSFYFTNEFGSTSTVQALKVGTNDPAVDVFPLTWASSPWNLTGVSNIVTWVNGGTQYVGWAATQNTAIMASNETYNFTTANNQAAIQSTIDARMFNLGGYTLSFEFAAGTYASTYFICSNFYNGSLILTGAIVATDTAHSNQTTIISAGTRTEGIRIKDCMASVTLKNIKVLIQTDAYRRAVSIIRCNKDVLIKDNAFIGTTTADGRGFYTENSPLISLQTSVFSFFAQSVEAHYLSRIYFQGCVCAGTTPTYGLTIYHGSAAYRADTNACGTTANLANWGGQIVTSAGLISP